jgi:cleavage stimulation factor subunit 3
VCRADASVLLSFAGAEHEEERKNNAAAHAYFTGILEQLSAEADELQAVLAREVEGAMGPEVLKPGEAGGGMDVDEDGAQIEYARRVSEREARGEAVRERRGKDVEAVKETMGVVWVMYMRFARRSEVSVGAWRERGKKLMARGSRLRGRCLGRRASRHM